DEFVDALGRMYAEPLADEPAHRDAAKGEAIDAQRVSQSQDVHAQLFDRIGSLACYGFAMASSVVSQDPIMSSQIIGLFFPQGQGGAQRIGEYDCLCRFCALKVVLENLTADLNR